MATKQHDPTLWEALPKQEQERIKKMLNNLPDPNQGKGKGKGKGGFELKGYVRCDLSKTEKEAYLEWELNSSDESCYGELIKLADSGYLLKVGENGGSVQASLCAANTGHTWDGYVLTAHAGNASRAVQLLIYKHQNLLRGDWSECLQDEGEDAFR